MYKDTGLSSPVGDKATLFGITMKCFGFDTSNYTTSVSSFSENRQINIGKLLPVPDSARGLRQSDALFHHIRALPDLVSQLIAAVGNGADAVAVSTAPRRAEGSYMPCFLAGNTVAHTLAAGMGVPLYTFSHQEGHLAAAAYSADCPELFHTPFLAWHLSGGTTELLHCTPSDHFSFQVDCIGGSLDISAGQCVDRAGVALGIPFPCGIALEELSISGKTSSVYRAKSDDLYFNLSGMENQFMNRIRQNESPEDVAAFVLSSIEEIIAATTKKALQRFPGLPVLCSGGVMSCRSLQRRMHTEFGAMTAAPQYSRDNALGIAYLGYLKAGGNPNGFSIDRQ